MCSLPLIVLNCADYPDNLVPTSASVAESVYWLAIVRFIYAQTTPMEFNMKSTETKTKLDVLPC